MKRALVLVALAASPAFADSKEADKLFDQGKSQLAKKQYREACETFEKVDKLDPGIGAKLNVARCFEEWGKLAIAWRWYTDALNMATTANDKRAKKIAELIDALDPDVPRIAVKYNADADPAAGKVTLDGAPLANLDIEQRVDPGTHELVYTGADGTRKTKSIPLERGGSTEVTIELPKKKPVVHHEAPSPVRKYAAVGLVVGSAALFGTSAYLALDARSNYKDALAVHCAGDKHLCDDAGVTITRNARIQANHATIFAVAGAALAAGGVVLFVTTPKAGKEGVVSYIAPAGTGVVFGGSF